MILVICVVASSVCELNLQIRSEWYTYTDKINWGVWWVGELPDFVTYPLQNFWQLNNCEMQNGTVDNWFQLCRKKDTNSHFHNFYVLNIKAIIRSHSSPKPHFSQGLNKIPNWFCSLIHSKFKRCWAVHIAQHTQGSSGVITHVKEFWTGYGCGKK